jgi:hypothetical protein
MIGRHIQECPKHPMRAIEAERDALKAEVEGLGSFLAKVKALALAVREGFEVGDRSMDAPLSAVLDSPEMKEQKP